jgi:hypothetical protein
LLGFIAQDQVLAALRNRAYVARGLSAEDEPFLAREVHLAGKVVLEAADLYRRNPDRDQKRVEIEFDRVNGQHPDRCQRKNFPALIVHQDHRGRVRVFGCESGDVVGVGVRNPDRAWAGELSFVILKASE